jgi:hypothetical protein
LTISALSTIASTAICKTNCFDLRADSESGKNTDRREVARSRGTTTLSAGEDHRSAGSHRPIGAQPQRVVRADPRQVIPRLRVASRQSATGTERERQEAGRLWRSYSPLAGLARGRDWVHLLRSLILPFPPLPYGNRRPDRPPVCFLMCQKHTTHPGIHRVR